MVVGDTLWALDTTDRLHTRTNVTADNIKGGTKHLQLLSKHNYLANVRWE